MPLVCRHGPFSWNGCFVESLAAPLEHAPREALRSSTVLASDSGSSTAPVTGSTCRPPAISSGSINGMVNNHAFRAELCLIRRIRVDITGHLPRPKEVFFKVRAARRADSGFT